MEIYVACDVCGHRYELPEEREGRAFKCRSCGVSFDVDRENYYDPETSELDVDEDDSSDGDSMSPVWTIARNIGNGLAGLAAFGIILWMASLLFRSPQQLSAQSNVPAQQPVHRPLPGQSHNVPFQGNLPPGFNPNPQGITPNRPFPGISPNPLPGGVVAPPPVIDGSVGWPTGDESPAKEAVKPTPTPRRSTRGGEFHVNQSVEVLKDGEWQPAIIRRPDRAGMYRIHYKGTSQGDDETVPVSRIRVP